MAISFINTANGGTLSTTSFSITLPATAAGDIIVLEYTHRGTADGTIGGTYSGPALVRKHEQPYASSTFSGKTWWTRCTGNHTGQTITGSGLTNSSAAVVSIYRGALAVGDPLSAAFAIIGEQNASGNETQAEIRTLHANAWVVLVVANSPDVAVTSPACTSPGALTIRSEVLSTGGTDTAINHSSAAKASAGVTGSFTWSQTDGASGSWAYAIQEEPSAAVPDDGNEGGDRCASAVRTALAVGAMAASTAWAGYAQQVAAQPQDEIAPATTTGGGGQVHAVLPPTQQGARVSYYYTPDEVPPQAPAFIPSDDAYFPPPPYVAPPVFAHPIAPSDEAPPLDVAPPFDPWTWEPPLVVPPRLSIDVPQLQDDLPPAPAGGEGGGGYSAFVAPPAHGPPRVRYAYADDGIVPSAAAAPAVEDFWFHQPRATVADVYIPAPWAFGGDEAVPGAITEDYWFHAPPAQRTPVQQLPIVSDDDFVATPVAITVSEDYWSAAYLPSLPAPVRLHTTPVVELSDVVPPPGIAYEDYWWVPLRPQVWPITIPWPFVWEAPAAGLTGVVAVDTPTRRGKYKPEHDSALVDLEAARDFAAEHTSALADLRDAGV